MPRLAALLFKQPHIRDDHAAVYRFAHVVNGEEGHLHRSERFHFHACLSHGFCRSGAHNGELKTFICPKFCGLVGQDWDKDSS